MIEVRQAAPDEVGAALAPIWNYFGSRPEAEELERFATILPAERVLAGFDGDEIVGGAGAYLFDTTVPGGAQVATAGVMAVGVLPTHRRRGVLTAIMRRQLADAHERGEPIAMLYAAEGGIYGRFGYGLAALAGDIELPKEHARPWHDEPLGEARLLDPDEGSRCRRRRRARRPEPRRGLARARSARRALSLEPGALAGRGRLGLAHDRSARPGA